jgi:adenylate cyclase
MVIGLLGKDAHAALDAIERALSSNPSSAVAYYFGAELNAWGGHPRTGTTYAHRALRLSPFDPLTYIGHMAFAIAALDEGRYDESATWWAKCSQANPDFGGFVMGQAVALALAGRMDEARSACARARELEPGLSVRTARELGYAAEIEAKLVRTHRLLGLPES